MRSRVLVAAAALTTAGLALAGCSGSGSGDDDNVLRLWHFESETSAMGIAWNEAIRVFEEETGATVEFEARGFEQIRQTASQVLNSDEAPDILEYNKGNATAGLLASQGLLAPITEQVEEYGWDELLAPALQTTARYSDEGVMG
jgi:raffinose/stachyose/melibiose transport system substrate-binding protein